MATRKTLLDTEQTPAGEKAKSRRGQPKNWLVTYKLDGDRREIPVEALDAHKAQAVVQANMPACEVVQVVLDDDAARRVALADGGPATERAQADAENRPARPDPKVKPNRGRVKAARLPESQKVAEQAKPEIKGKTSTAVSKADNKKATGGRKPAAAATPEPKPNPNAAQADRAQEKAKLQAEVVKLWNASKEQDAGARRKAIAKQLKIPGRVMGILRDAGIDGKKV
jgi:hypothetical protein